MTVYPRRLQRLGTTTLVVSLPKQWASERGLKPGDIIYIEVNGDRLIIHGREVTQEPISAIVSADEVEQPDALSKIVASCFLQGYDTVRITSNLGLTESQVQAVLATVEWLPGFEVVEQTPRSIVLQAIIDPTKFKIEAIIRRLNVLVTSMVSIAIDTLVRGASEKVGEVIETGKKLEELYHLAVRQLIISLKNPSLAQPIGIDSPIAVLGYRMVVKALEEAGQHAISLAKESLNVRHKEAQINRAVINRLVSLAEEVQNLISTGVTSFLTLDLKTINRVFESLQTVEEDVEMAERELIEQVEDPEVSLSLRMSLMRLLAMLGSAKTVAEVALNKFVRMRSSVVQMAPAS